jgi:queuine tRNA-ribosyltransferase
VSLDCEVVLTRSGAPAMRDRISGEVMHPIVGPRVEAAALYVGPSRLRERLLEPNPLPLRLLDVGLGAGSNAVAAWQLSQSFTAPARRLEIVSFDRSLAALERALEPAHRAAFGFDGAAGDAAAALIREHRSESARSDWRLHVGELPGTLSRESEPRAEVVFWDPFSPRENPNLWGMSAFRALFRCCHERVSVHTYSGATAMRAALLLAGFAVGEGEPTVAGKRTTVAARAPSELAQPLDKRWFARLARSSAPFPPDAPPEALELIRSLPQFAG